jgi:hypothetical protein
MLDDLRSLDNLGPDQLLSRIAEVSALLHDEQGDRGELKRERTRLVELAKQRRLFPFNRNHSD